MVAKDRPQLNLRLSAFKLGLRVAFKDPLALFNYINSGLGKSVEAQVYNLVQSVGWDTWQLAGYWDSIRSNAKLQNHITSKLGGVNYGQIIAPELLYVLVRKLCPKVVVETGVAAGVSSAYILQALHDNDYGKLYSIDYPNTGLEEAEFIPDGESGFVVPDYLRERWSLNIGKSCNLLPALLTKLSDIDMFFHDSDHSYDNMWNEFRLAFGFLKHGGLLVSHDIDQNTSFWDFVKSVKHKANEVYFTNIGVIRK